MQVQLDRDLLILEKALNGKAPDFDPSEDWKLPILIEQYKNRNVNMYTPTAWDSDESRPSCSSTHANAKNTSSQPSIFVTSQSISVSHRPYAY